MAGDLSDATCNHYPVPSRDGKGACVGILATGFGELVTATRFQVHLAPKFGNFRAFPLYLGPHHMIMCYSIFTNNELGSVAPTSERRREETGPIHPRK